MVRPTVAEGRLLRGGRQDDCVRRSPLARHDPESANELAHRDQLRPSFRAQGLSFRDTAIVVERGTDSFDTLLGRYRGALGPRMRAIVAITVTKALPLTSPVYDDGKAEQDVRRGWTTRFRKLQPNEQFEE